MRVMYNSTYSVHFDRTHALTTLPATTDSPADGTSGMGGQRHPVRPGRSEVCSRREVASGQSSPRTKKRAREGAEDPSNRER